MYIPGTAFAVVDAELLTRRDDTLPIQNEVPHHLAMELRLHHPGFQRPQHALSAGTQNGTSFKATIEGSGNQSTLHYRFKGGPRWYEGPAREDFLQFCADYLKYKKDMFIFARSNP